MLRDPLPADRVAVVEQTEMRRIEKRELRGRQPLHQERRIGVGAAGERRRLFEQRAIEAAGRTRVVRKCEVERSIQRDEREALQRPRNISECLFQNREILGPYFAAAAVVDGGQHER
jgi:hypothetical protein